VNKKDKVFLLTKTPYKESDLVINLLSASEGKLSTIIYGGKKIGTRSSFTYHPGDLLEIEYRIKEEKDFIQILNIHALSLQDIDSFSYHRFLFHSYLLEIITKITQPGNPAEELFETLVTNLQLKWESNELWNICWMIWQIIKNGGYAIDFLRCAICEKEIWRSTSQNDVSLRKASYQLKENSGQLVCDQCKPLPDGKPTISAAMIKILWLFENSSELTEVSQHVPGVFLVKLIKFLNHHLLQSFDFSPKSLPLFLSSLKDSTAD